MLREEIFSDDALEEQFVCNWLSMAAEFLLLLRETRDVPSGAVNVIAEGNFLDE